MQIVEPRKIARRYIRTWFFIDLVSMTPFDLLEVWFTDSSNPRVPKLFKFSELLRLLKIMNVIKMLKLIRRSGKFNEWLNGLDINVNFIRMLKFQLLSLLLTHLMSCIWFKVATF